MSTAQIVLLIVVILIVVAIAAAVWIRRRRSGHVLIATGDPVTHRRGDRP